MNHLSIVTPTKGRISLLELLESTQGPWEPEDEWIVVVDARWPEAAWVKKHVDALGHPFRTLECSKEGISGHPQRNFALPHVREGNYLVWNDDSDLFAENGISLIRENVDGPTLFSFSLYGTIVPGDNPVSVGSIGGHQFVAPNLPGKVGRWGDRYEGDFDFIESTLELWGTEPKRVNEVISIARSPK